MSSLLKHEFAEGHDIPLAWLEYSFIETCEDPKKLEKVIKLLRSGDEGHFPDLEQFAEKRLKAINPESKVLRKCAPVKSSRDLGTEQWMDIDKDIKDWSSEIGGIEKTLKSGEIGESKQKSDLPPVRGTSQTINMTMKTTQSTTDNTKKNKRVKPREYHEWDKVNVDEELAKVDQEGEKKEVKNVMRKPSKPEIPTSIDTTGLTTKEREVVATREKDKGNEAFRSGDYEEAVLYYSRSLSVISNIAACNNRAQAYLKLKKWDNALQDCNSVLSEEPNNMKGLLRRGVAYQGKKQYTNARNDLQRVMEVEPNNKRATDILKEIDKAFKEQKTKGRRMVIQEVGSDEEENVLLNSKLKINEVENNSKARPKIEEISEVKPIVDKMVNGNSEGNHEQQDTILSKCETEKNIWTEEEIVKNEEKSDMENGEKRDVAEKSVENRTEHKAPTNSKKCKNKKKNKKHKNGDISEQESTQEDSEAQSAADVIIDKQKETVSLEKERTECDSVPPNVPYNDRIQTTESSPSESTVVEPPAPPPPLPSDVTKLKDEGLEYFKKGQYSDAAEKYTTAIDKLLTVDDIHKLNLSVLYSNRAACMSKIGKCEACVRDCNEALKRSPTSVKALLRRAAAYESMEKFRRAYVDFRQALYVDGTLTLAHQGIARCTNMMQQMDGPRWRDKLPSVTPVAFSHPPQQTSVPPSKTKSEIEKPQSIPETSSLPPPELTLQQLYEKHKEEGKVFVTKGDFQKAVDSYTECIRLCPKEVVSYTNRALCYLRLNKSELVISDCDAALQEEPNNIKALFRRAQANKMLQRYGPSLTDLRKVLSLDPKNTAAKREMQLVTKYLQEFVANEKAKSQAESKKSKKKIKIQEVDSDSDDESLLQSNHTPKNPPKIEEVGPSPVQKDSKSEPLVNSQSDPTTQEKTLPKPETAATPKQGSSKSQKQSKKSKNVKVEETQKESKKVIVPELKKTTPYEFIQAWTSLRSSQGIEPYAKLFEQIEPEDVPKVISNKLDGDMLRNIIQCIKLLVEKGGGSQTEGGAAKEGLASRALAYLQNLTTVPRFNTITMFMSDKDKADLSSLLNKLVEQSSCSLVVQDINKLRKIYSVS